MKDNNGTQALYDKGTLLRAYDKGTLLRATATRGGLYLVVGPSPRSASSAWTYQRAYSFNEGMVVTIDLAFYVPVGKGQRT